MTVSSYEESSYEERRRLERLDADDLAQCQIQRFNALIDKILPHNRFYAEKLAETRFPLTSLDELAQLPFTFKEELVNPHSDGELAANLSFPVERYVRYHRTSGTRGRPLPVLDTEEDWAWWIATWQYVLDAAELGPADRVVMAFSFGPFIGFWSAYDAVAARQALVIPSGGMGTLARLELIRSSRATAVFCTPSYALHMAEVAAENQVDVAALEVRALVVAGEPGGSVPATRDRIERAWNARVIDHAGASEIGPWGYADGQQQGMHVIESEFIAEFLSVQSGQAAGEGELAELVLTTLGRAGSPVIRYRTGDLVRPTWNSPGPNKFVLLDHGVLGRADDMLVIRGVNIYPTSIEQILRGFPEVVEYRMTACTAGEMDALTIEIEDRLNAPQRVAAELQLHLGLKVDVHPVPLGSLPRFEGKGRRFVNQRPAR